MLNAATRCSIETELIRENNFSSRMVRKPSPFNLFRSLEGGTTGSTGVTGSVWAGTDSGVGGVTAERTLVDVG
ncbi:hypothetical protein H5410_002865 [Solanum commersonii]|uniref:Uncharacterized protein n=1 Tax=Solanum commersonii TaxID=4109 RepID=A0A9J6B3D2_SOLCO|nr:hypothetical protein H5410_002865 [Solanum commersonii]